MICRFRNRRLSAEGPDLQEVVRNVFVDPDDEAIKYLFESTIWKKNHHGRLVCAA